MDQLGPAWPGHQVDDPGTVGCRRKSAKLLEGNSTGRGANGPGDHMLAGGRQVLSSRAELQAPDLTQRLARADLGEQVPGRGTPNPDCAGEVSGREQGPIRVEYGRLDVARVSG